MRAGHLVGRCSGTCACQRQTRRTGPFLSRHFFFRHVQKLRRSRRPISRSGAGPPEMKTKLKISKLFRRRENKLRATTLRRQLRTAATVKDYEEMTEPNMKLSRALLIVLLFHVVGVQGIIALNAI